MVISLVVAIICFAIGLTLVLVKKDARHVLVPALVPLALVPAVLVSGLVAHQLQWTFSLSATSGAQVMVDQLVGVARTVFAGRLCALVLLALAGLLVVRGLLGPAEGVAPRGRVAVLALVPAVAIGMALLMGWSEERLMRAVTLVMAPTALNTPAMEQELKQLVSGSSAGELQVAQISEFAARQIILLMLGAPLLALAFVALAGLLAATGWRPLRSGSPHGPALGLALSIAVVGAWTASAYRRIGQVEDWARAVTGPQEREPAQLPLPASPEAPDPALLARCEAGQARACASMGGLMEDRERLALYERVCAKAGGEVCADLASLHLNGIGTSADPARARALYERACHTGDASACGLFEQLSKPAAP